MSSTPDRYARATLPIPDRPVLGLGSVEGWVSLARQARANPDYDISKELALPARLPPWAEARNAHPNTWPPCERRSRRCASTQR